MARQSVATKDPRKILKDQLTDLFSARSHLQQVITALEESFRSMPTHDKVRRLAERRHEIHLIELDIVDIDDRFTDLEIQYREVQKALRTLPRV